MTHEDKNFGQNHLETRQICRRLYDLLPMRLKQLKDQHVGNLAAGQAERRALTSPEYKNAIEEYVNIAAQYRRQRVRFEILMMKKNAERSLRSFLNK